VIQLYKTPRVFLLARVFPGGVLDSDIDSFAHRLVRERGLVFSRPWKLEVPCVDMKQLELVMKERLHVDPTTEGLILIDYSGKLLKIKTPTFVICHKLKYLGWVTASSATCVPLILQRAPPPPPPPPPSSHVSAPPISTLEWSSPSTMERKDGNAPTKDDRASHTAVTMMDWIMENTPFTPAERARVEQRLTIFKTVIATTRTILLREWGNLETTKIDAQSILKVCSVTRDDVPRFLVSSSVKGKKHANLFALKPLLFALFNWYSEAETNRSDWRAFIETGALLSTCLNIVVAFCDTELH
jgi:hypothetical protein